MTPTHQQFRLRILVEQVLQVQSYPSTPVDSGRSEQIIKHEEQIIDLNPSEFSEAIRDPVGTAATLMG